MIVAREFRVDPQAPRSWSFEDFYGALQLLTEERVGRAVRRQNQDEDAAWRRAHDALR